MTFYLLQRRALFICQELDVCDMVNAEMAQLLVVKNTGNEIIKAIHTSHFVGMQDIKALFLSLLAWYELAFNADVIIGTAYLQAFGNGSVDDLQIAEELLVTLMDIVLHRAGVFETTKMLIVKGFQGLDELLRIVAGQGFCCGQLTDQSLQMHGGQYSIQ